MLSSIVRGIRLYLAENPALDGAVKHAIAAFIGTFVTLEVGLLQHLNVTGFSPAAVESAEISVVVAAISAALAVIVPTLLAWARNLENPPQTP